MAYKGYKDKEKRREYKKLQMREYRQRCKEEFVRKAWEKAEQALELGKARLLNASKDHLIQMMLESPTFAKLSQAERIRQVRDSYELMERGAEAMAVEMRPGIAKTIEDSWLDVEQEIVKVAERGLDRRWRRELLDAPLDVQKRGHEAIVADTVKEIREVRKQIGLI